LQIETPVDQAALEVACQKLTDSGIFDSVTYRYAPGPKLPAFNRKVPGNETAQQFIAQRIQDHLSANSKAGLLSGRLEAEFVPRKRMIISFQPEALPQIASVNLTGVHELSSARLTEIKELMVKA
jgi:hypothetical protein